MTERKYSKAEYLALFIKKIPEYRKNPVQYAREVLFFEPDEWQKEALRDLAVKPRVAIKSGQGVGKTGIEAVAALWFLSCFSDARIVATAPTRQQLNDVLWSEIAKWMAKSPILPKILKWTKTYIYVVGYEKRWFAVARTATKPENMQGFHEDNMLFIVDEASGVADPIMEAITGTLSGVNNKLLMCGNPTKTTGTFHDAFTADRALYVCHTVNAENVARTNKDNIAAMVRKYGRDSNVCRVRIFGEFPIQDDDVFIRSDIVEQSINTEPRTFGRDEEGNVTVEQEITRMEIGVDVARFGNDKSCIGYIINEVFQFQEKINGQDTMKTASKIAALGLKLLAMYGDEAKLGDKAYKLGRIAIKVDDGGVGGGVVDRLKQMKELYPDLYGWMVIMPVNFGIPLSNHRYFYDSTTYMMSVVRDMLSPEDEDGKTKPVELILPNDSELVAQLTTRKYEFKDNGKVAVESKKKYKERMDGASPDEADCLILTCMPVKLKKIHKGVKQG